MARQTMNNIAYTGSTDFGSSSMYGDLERKGGMVMSNRPYTSDMSGMEDIIGAKVAASEMKKAQKDAKHAAAAIKIDSRIEKMLKGAYAPAYASASTTKNKQKFLDNTIKLLFGLAGDEGIGGMVENLNAVTSEFGGLAQLQRAMVRRLGERSTYMNRGWFSRLLSGEKHLEDLTAEDFKKLVAAMPMSDRKGSDLVNKDAPATMSAAPVEVVSIDQPIAFSSSPMQTTKGLGLGPMVNQAVTGGMGHRGEPMGNAAITGAYDLVGHSLSGHGAEAMVNAAITGAGDFRRDSGRRVHVGMEDIIGNERGMAASKMDERIAMLLKPYWSSVYRVATMGNEVERKCAANSLMIAMLSDEGLAGMVKSMDAVAAQFENIGLMQRAMGRRLKECCEAKPSTGKSCNCPGMCNCGTSTGAMFADVVTSGVDILTSGADVLVRGSCDCKGGCLCE